MTVFASFKYIKTTPLMITWETYMD